MDLFDKYCHIKYEMNDAHTHTGYVDAMRNIAASLSLLSVNFSFVRPLAWPCRSPWTLPQQQQFKLYTKIVWSLCVFVWMMAKAHSPFNIYYDTCIYLCSVDNVAFVVYAICEIRYSPLTCTRSTRSMGNNMLIGFVSIYILLNENIRGWSCSCSNFEWISLCIWPRCANKLSALIFFYGGTNEKFKNISCIEHIHNFVQNKTINDHCYQKLVGNLRWQRQNIGCK